MVQKTHEIEEFFLKKSVAIKNSVALYKLIKEYSGLMSSDVTLSLVKIKNSEVEVWGDSLADKYQHFDETVLKLSEKFKSVGQKKKMPEYNLTALLTHQTDDEKEVCLFLFKKQESEIDFFHSHFLCYIRYSHEYRKIVDMNRILLALSHTDEITGLYNQRRLHYDLEHAIKEHSENEKRFSVMFIDVDHFKMVNDNYGHLIGSQILSDLGSLLRTLLRSTDDIYRYGGDEFIVLLREVHLKQVKEVALRILEAVVVNDFRMQNGDVYKMSVSIGIAEFPTDAQTSSEIIHYADQMMYQSKRAGRGKVFHLGEEIDDSSDGE